MLIRVKGQGRGVKFLGLEVILGQFYRASKKPSPLVFENVKKMQKFGIDYWMAKIIS